MNASVYMFEDKFTYSTEMCGTESIIAVTVGAVGVLVSTQDNHTATKKTENAKCSFELFSSPRG